MRRCSGCCSSVSNPLPIKFVAVSCPPIIVSMELAMISSSVSRTPSTSAFTREFTSPSWGIDLLFSNCRPEIFGHIADAACHARNAIRLVLKIPQNLREIDGPLLQLFVIAHRNAQHFGGNDGGHRRGQFSHDIRSSFADETGNQAVRDVLNMPAQYRDPRGSKRCGAEVSQSRVNRRIPEQHLPGHDLNDWIHCPEAHVVQLLRCERSVSRQAAQDRYNVSIPRNYPRMQESIPMHGIGFTQFPIQPVGGSHDIRLHELTQTEAGIH